MPSPSEHLATIDDPRAVTMLTTVMSSVGSEFECARLMVSGVRSVVNCAECWVALNEPDSTRCQRLIDHKGRSFSEDEILRCQPALALLHREFVDRGQSPLVVSVAKEKRLVPSFVNRSLATEIAVLSVATLRNQLGMFIAVPFAPASFSENDTNVFQTILQHFALTVENCRLSEALEQSNLNLQQVVETRTSQLRQSEERHRALLQINNAIVANLHRDSLLQAVASALQNTCSFDRASLVLHDAERDTLIVYALVAGTTSHAAPIGTEFPRRGSHLESVFTDRKPIVRADLSIGNRTEIEEDLHSKHLRSYIAAPLIGKSRILGTLNFASRSTDAYDEHDAEYLLEVANQVALALENALAYEKIEELKQQLARENEYLREQDTSAGGFGEIVGASPALAQALEQVRLVASTDASVIILGESGTGKELIARAIHDQSNRRDGPLIRVNCAAVPAELFESEFFGHAKGAFTGAFKERAGRFELADGGTLFLDEIAEIPLQLQSKLLRVLQEGTFERVGEDKTRKVEVRVVAATNRELHAEVQEGRFRQDLYYRVSVFPVELPPLRERRDDIGLLAQHFVQIATTRLGRQPLAIRASDVDQLRNYDWPGNIRELQNIIERAVILSPGSELEIAGCLPQGVQSPDVEPLSLEAVERNHIVSVLEMASWRVSGSGGAAEMLGLKPTTLEARMKKLGIQRPAP